MLFQRAMKHLGQDVRFALRSVWKRPGFAAIVVAVLALCIGANTTMFTIIDSTLLHALPFRSPDRLVSLTERLSAVMQGPIPFSTPDYQELLRRSHSFERIGIFRNRTFELSGINEPSQLQGARISASLFPTLGISPALGRNFTAEEDRNAHRVAILSAALWRSQFGGDPAVIGKTITLDRNPYTIVGVMPQGIAFPMRGPEFNNEPAQVYVPFSFTKAELEGWGNMYNHSVIARLRRGVTVEQARAEVKSVIERVYQETYPASLRTTNFGLSADVTILREEIQGKLEPILLVLFGAVGLVLLIGCADVASLLLTRGASRQREMSIRTALGASRMQLIRQVLLESLVLALLGGLLGQLLSFWTRSVLVHAAQLSLPITGVSDSSGRVLLFTFLLSLLTALVFGLFPSLQASQTDVIRGLREGGRSQTSGKKQGRTLTALVTAQFALALVLLIGAGLLLRSFSRLLATNPGFRPDHILTMSVSLPANAYESGSQVRSFYERVQRSLETLPGVKEAAIATSLPLSVNEHRTFSIEGQLPQTLNIPREVAHIWSMGAFFRAMGIPLQAGRFFDFRDSRQSLPVAIVNETLAHRFWPGQNAVGKRIKWGENGSTNINPWMTIVGVVKDVKQSALDQAIEPESYTPYEQVKDDDLGDNVTSEFRALKIVVRTSGTPMAEISAIKRQIGLLDASLPITQVATMEDRLSDSTRSQRFNTWLLGIFAAVAVILAALGIAGVLAYSVAQRIPEIGLRLALGARKADVLRLVVVRGMRMAFAGTLIGIVFSLALSSVLASFLYDVSRYDAWTFLGAPCFLCVVALVSVWIPARRAAAVDPIQALRAE